ncbi:hypothetical protein [Cellulomonas soli]
MTEGERHFDFVMVEDSPLARQFIELSSYAADLFEAHTALGLALRTTAADPPLRDAQRSLVANATMAYCRTFFPSKVRRPLTEFVAIPAELIATHELVATFRNRTIAHSQSDLSVTYAVGVLDAETGEVLDVSAPNLSSSLPLEHVRAFFDLVTTVMDRLDDVIESIRAQLIHELATADHAEPVRVASRPTARHLLGQDFQPRTTRSPYPTSHPLYWTIDAAE